MEIIRGKKTSFINAEQLTEKINPYSAIHLDIGTGDGRFVRHLAQENPQQFVIGIDACRENLHTVSRQRLDNALFVIANARALPSELSGIASSVSLNFPWGSLIEGLLNDDLAMMTSLSNVLQPSTRIEVRVNGGALAQAGWDFDDGANRIHSVLSRNGWRMKNTRLMSVDDLQTCPTTWAKRLAFGRDPRAMCLQGVLFSFKKYM